MEMNWAYETLTDVEKFGGFELNIGDLAPTITMKTSCF